MKSGKLLVLPIHGIILSGESSQSMPLPFLPFGMFWATFSEDLIRTLEKIKSSKKVKAILFSIDSPGGTPYASKEIADAVKSLPVPTIAQIKEHGTSGAYWIASSCKKIVADELSYIGGIGTRADRLDFSGLAKKIGIKMESFSKGEYKGMGSPYEEPSQKEKAFIEEQVTAFNEVFVSQIKKNRSITDEKVLENITSGRPYLGKDALALGLIDHLGKEELAIQIASDLAGKPLKPVYLKIGRARETLTSRMLKRFF